MTAQVPRILAITVQPPTSLLIRLDSTPDVEQTVNLADWIRRGGDRFSALLEPDTFGRVAIGAYGGNLTWDDDEGDLAIDSVHLEAIAAEQKPSTDAKDELKKIREAIDGSRATAYLNNMHARTFTLNIFKTNAQELRTAVNHVSDPDRGLRLMSQAHREEGVQAHREVNRRIHNFIASAKTLVDHTRVFMEKHYSSTSLITLYHARVAETFTDDPLSKFVHDLRNFMLHRALPSSSMFVRFNREGNDEDGTAEITTGIEIPTNALKEFHGWTAAAREFINRAKEAIPVGSFFDDYYKNVIGFHDWLDERLEEYHAEDLRTLAVLQARYRSMQSMLTSTAKAVSLAQVQHAKSEPEKQKTFEIDAAGAALRERLREIEFDGSARRLLFPSQRPIEATITSDKMLGPIQFHGRDKNGRDVLALSVQNGRAYGLDEEKEEELYSLSENVASTVPLRPVSSKFIAESILDWLHSSLQTGPVELLSRRINRVISEKVRPLEAWFPIAHLEIEEAFAFGPVSIKPITAAMIDGLEAEGIASAPNQESDIRKLFEDIRRDFQGFAAIVLGVEAEPIRAREMGLEIAQTALGLLRFFSPAAQRSWMLCPLTIVGTDTIPRTKTMVLGEGSFQLTDSVSFDQVSRWQLRREELQALWVRGLGTVPKLITEAGLNSYEKAIRTSILVYSSGMGFATKGDRLIHTITALESMLVKHGMESAEANVEERVACLIPRSNVENAAQVVRAAYRLRSRYDNSSFNEFDEDIFQKFVQIAHGVISFALGNIDKFASLSTFIDTLDRQRSPEGRA